MNTLIKKLSSRKLWAAVVGIATGLGLVFGLDENIISTVSGAVVALTSIITYIITEGKVDAAAVKSAVESVQAAKDAISESTEGGGSDNDGTAN